MYFERPISGPGFEGASRVGVCREEAVAAIGEAPGSHGKKQKRKFRQARLMPPPGKKICKGWTQHAISPLFPKITLRKPPDVDEGCLHRARSRGGQVNTREENGFTNNKARFRFRAPLLTAADCRGRAFFSPQQPHTPHTPEFLRCLPGCPAPRGDVMYSNTPFKPICLAKPQRKNKAQLHPPTNTSFVG